MKGTIEFALDYDPYEQVIEDPGKPLAVVTPPEGPSSLEDLYGSMRGRSHPLATIDLTEPIHDGPLPQDPVLGSDDGGA